MRRVVPRSRSLALRTPATAEVRVMWTLMVVGPVDQIVGLYQAEGGNGCRCCIGGREGERDATGVCVGGGENPSWERCGLTNVLELSTAGTVAFALELTVYRKGLTHDVPVGAPNSFQPSASTSLSLALTSPQRLWWCLCAGGTSTDEHGQRGGDDRRPPHPTAAVHRRLSVRHTARLAL
jgi:hypothetical protein